ncbi:outer membrane lipoprotein carrier protein LolA [Chitinilyticum litopenaei]|uniref:outer membrane lipoprotein carrier protein LolA n=1 Tax=Chitinilyticum litopenaei TaxID=1121276 RepID=UPI0004102E6D|nr:outer membrane lipoprotein carrier protein LolA [Chitinilyticum litopenaei]
MTRIAFLVLASVFFVGAAHAGLIDEVRERTGLRDAQRGEFSQEKRIASLSKPLRASGQFVYLKERGLLWRIEQPYASDATITATTLVQQVRGKTVLKVDAQTQPAYSAVSRIFMALVGNDWKALEQDFMIAGNVSGASWQLVLTPRGGLFASFASTLTLSGSRAIERLDIAEKNGDRTVYTFSKVREAGALSADEESRFALK